MKNNAAIALMTLVAANCVTVNVRFKDHNGNAVGQAYTYKAPNDMKLEAGDEVVVDAPSTGMTVVVVTDVHTTAKIDIEAPFRYKWVVAKVDRKAYDDLLAKDDAATEKVEELQREAQKTRALETLMTELNLDKGGLEELLKNLA